MALALVLGQLRRIAEALRGKPLVRAESTETAVASVSSAAAAPAVVQPPAPEPPAVEPPRAPEPRATESRPPVTANEPAAGPLDWLRVKSKPVTTSAPSAPMPTVPGPHPAIEPSMMDVTDEAPLSPRPPPRPPMPSPNDPAAEPKVWSPNRDANPPEPRPAPRLEQPSPRAAPQAEPPKDKERFDLVWPDRTPAPAPIEPKPEIRREPSLEMPLPPIPARPRENRLATERRMPELARKMPDRGPAILKSGVIDGMPYTLYADGSIEAQLPQGMVKFASVDALRAHLEKQG
jgi:hypothetical protein